ncbi:MAG: ribosome silencing factor [Clostridia bacterium]|nr:ribosome silencing factor [Lachnospiraceae bacterium]NCC00626.1 ribosome silencing factor [Clostridia bacterium]NCD02638.1 ribosome silencing factor [Clostridia bacterium]
MNNSKEMTRLAIKALEDKKGSDIRVIDIQEVSIIADYFIIASGSNRNQVQTMADNVKEVLGRAGFEPRQLEGYGTAAWILMDYNDIIIHIFSEEDRLFYDIERIWKDGKAVATTEFNAEN